MTKVLNLNFEDEKTKGGGGGISFKKLDYPLNEIHIHDYYKLVYISLII